ncbi:MAG: hypothetical protein Q8Q03_02715, partial [bacterium]|nr:hypothetical protein [bacterium]
YMSDVSIVKFMVMAVLYQRRDILYPKVDVRGEEWGGMCRLQALQLAIVFGKRIASVVKIASG